MLPAIAGQAEGDLGRRGAAEDPVGPAVRRGGVADHGEAVLARLEGLGLLMHRLCRPPPPLLMHIGAVGGVHQTDDGVVDMGVEIHPFDHLRPATHDAREQGRLVVGFGCRARVGGHPDEDHPLAFAHGIGPHADAIGLIGLVLDQRRNGGADAVGAEAPAVVAAFDGLALAGLLDQPAGREGRRAVGTDVAHGVDLARPTLRTPRPADQHGLAEQFVPLERGRRDVARQGHEIPGVEHEPLAERGRRGLGLGRFRRDGGAVCGCHARQFSGL